MGSIPIRTWIGPREGFWVPLFMPRLLPHSPCSRFVLRGHGGGKVTEQMVLKANPTH